VVSNATMREDRTVRPRELHEQRFIVIATAALATTLRMTEANPGLAAKWPQQAGSFVFDDGLIVTTTDGLHWRIAIDTGAPRPISRRTPTASAVPAFWPPTGMAAIARLSSWFAS
jgi:hypothetical protein